jgi:hypothetical protein
MSPVGLTLAYKYVAVALMLMHVNFFAGKVGLKLDHPITEQDVRGGSHVSPPRTNNFSGSILTDDYSFGFGWGHLANFHRNDFRADSNAAVRELNARLSKSSSLIDTNGAHDLATNWLGIIGVDLQEAQRKYKLKITQWRYYPAGLSESPVLLPVFLVEWRGAPFKPPRRQIEMAVVALTILGTTKELIEFHVLDDSLFVRPGIAINDQDRLFSISDAEFQTFDALQRSNLVVQCSSRTRETNSPADRILR